MGLKIRILSLSNTKGHRMQGGRTRLPKFTFSANFPIGLHVILQLQIKKKSKMPNILCKKNILTENP